MSSKSQARRRLASAELPERAPTGAELAAIEAEWPLIAAELDVVDAMARMARAEGSPSELDWQALRRAEHRVSTTARDLTSRCRSAGPEVA